MGTSRVMLRDYKPQQKNPSLPQVRLHVLVRMKTNLEAENIKVLYLFVYVCVCMYVCIYVGVWWESGVRFFILHLFS